MQSKKIFLTGATGLVGTKLSEVFSSKGHQVKAISRNEQMPLNNVQWIIHDVQKKGISLADIISGCDIIIHNAACLKTGETPDEIKEIQEVNLEFTEKLLKSAVDVDVKKIVFTSGFNIVRKPLVPLITEEVALNPVTEYAKTKFLAEGMVRDYAFRYGISYDILRLSSPISLRIETMPDTVVKKWINQSMNNKTIKVYGNGSRTQDFIAVSDIANAFLCCIEKQVSGGTYNIASGTSLSMLQLAKLITKKFCNRYELNGTDPNENDQWNISIEKAKLELNFKPQFTSEAIIRKLLSTIEL